MQWRRRRRQSERMNNVAWALEMVVNVLVMMVVFV